MKYLSLLVLITTLLFSCNSEPTSRKTTSAPQATEAKPVATYPPLPMEEGKMLAENCDYIDYLFYQLPVSMSFHDPASVSAALRYIDGTPAPKAANCKSIGRVTYQSDGEIIMEAEMYFTNGCAHYVFLKDNKPTYGNMMTQAGSKFFTDLINRTKTTQAQ